MLNEEKSGIIVINKEIQMTSHDAVNRVRKIFNTKKVGHLGTLDPLASGVLVICLNEATKLVQFIENYDKEYIATICLGKSTTTYDLEGEVTETKKVTFLDEKDVDMALASFLGMSKQEPPIYSAVKVKGRKLYDYARNKIDVIIPSKDIMVYDIKRLSKIRYVDDLAYFDFKIKVSSGTYIRSICHDLGKRLGLPAVMTGLIRTMVGPFKLEEASTLQQLEKGEYQLYSMLEALKERPLIDDEKIAKKAFHGHLINYQDVTKYYKGERRIVIINKDKLIAIYELDVDNNFYKAVRVWN